MFSLLLTDIQLSLISLLLIPKYEVQDYQLILQTVDAFPYN